MQRHLGENPSVPPQYLDYYNKGLNDLKAFVVANIDKDLDESTFRIALSALATCDGKIKLGKAILELSEDVMNDFLEQF